MTHHRSGTPGIKFPRALRQSVRCKPRPPVIGKLLFPLEGGSSAKKIDFDIPKAQTFDLDDFLPHGPSSKLALSPLMDLSRILFVYGGEKKMMFQVMLFSMLHYSISQSNNSILVHQRFLSSLIVYDSLLPHICCSLHFPPVLPSGAFSGVQ